MKLERIQLSIAALILMFATEAHAVNLTLNFSSLPSAQGWELVNNTGDNEANLFSIDGTSLTQNTIGTGSSGWAYYQMSNILDTTKTYSFDVRVRILGEEFTSPGAFSFTATAPGWYSRVSLGVNNISIEDAGGEVQFAYDNSAFHDYRLVVSPSMSYDFFIDGTLKHSGVVTLAALPNRVYFGVPSSGVNGHAEISKFTFQQPVPAPEPSSTLMMLLGLGLLAALRMRMKNA